MKSPNHDLISCVWWIQMCLSLCRHYHVTFAINSVEYAPTLAECVSGRCVLDVFFFCGSTLVLSSSWPIWSDLFQWFLTSAFLEIRFRFAHRLNLCSGLCLLILRLMLEGPEVCLMLVTWQRGTCFSASSFAPTYLCPIRTWLKQTCKRPVCMINLISLLVTWCTNSLTF